MNRKRNVFQREETLTHSSNKSETRRRPVQLVCRARLRTPRARMVLVGQSEWNRISEIRRRFETDNETETKASRRGGVAGSPRRPPPRENEIRIARQQCRAQLTV